MPECPDGSCKTEVPDKPRRFHEEDEDGYGWAWFVNNDAAMVIQKIDATDRLMDNDEASLYAERLCSRAQEMHVSDRVHPAIDELTPERFRNLVRMARFVLKVSFEFGVDNRDQSPLTGRAAFTALMLCLENFDWIPQDSE